MELKLSELKQGEKLSELLVQELNKKGIVLHENHVNLNSLNVRIKDVCLESNRTEFLFENNNLILPVSLQNKCDDEYLRLGFAILYGNGKLRYNYDLPLFATKKCNLNTYLQFAVEIWDKNIHIDWMKYCGYKYHNGTKDFSFLSGMCSDLHEDKNRAINEHRLRSMRREKEDTPHHVFDDVDIFKSIIAKKGKHPLTEYLIESFYDQASAPFRWFKSREKSVSQRVSENKIRGYFINHAAKNWKPEIFGFTNNYESYLWNTWCEVNNRFKVYWQDKFGKNEEFWQPPMPLNYLEYLRIKS